MVREYMLDFGYNEREINKILSSSIIVKLKEETIYRKMVSISELLISVGYNKNEIIKIVKLHPRILGLTVENLKNKIDTLISLGYSIEIIKRITIKCPRIYSLNVRTIEEKVNNMMELGYTHKEVLEMIKIYPTIYTFNVLTMKNKIIEIMELGYSYEDIINLSKKFPQIYSLSIDNICEKVDFCNYMGLSDMIVKKKKILVQSVELSYTRYMFYKSMGIEINSSNCEMLFLSENVFIKRFNKTRNELLDLYKYDSSNLNVKKKIK